MRPVKARRGAPMKRRRPPGARCKKTRLVRYATNGDAIGAAVAVSRYVGPLEIQRCGWCGGWHLRRHRKDPK